MASLQPRARHPLSGLADLFEGAWPFGEHNLVRIEESLGEGTYVIRAELPGFDPERQIHVTTQAGLLTIAAEREAGKTEKGRSEFRYGSFVRTVTLPEGADTTKISAAYTDGILEITIPVAQAKAGQRVPIEVQKG
ncbi:MAG TPA: Hsp20/alpha crystallin family protein [Amycolatopsis sp.]|jgi:HSP20 family molecular chaperone IbpA|nr:Hsp20/alpha crystallin family protein [Amycolatopsis sp.]